MLRSGSIKDKYIIMNKFVKGQRVKLNNTGEACGVYKIVSDNATMVTVYDKICNSIKMLMVKNEEISPYICTKNNKVCDFICPASLINQDMCGMCDIPELKENMKNMVE